MTVEPTLVGVPVEDPYAGAETWWDGSVWVGEVDCSQVVPGPLQLVDGDRFARARVLVWDGDRVLGQVELDVVDGAVSGDELTAAVQRLPEPEEGFTFDRPAISVVVCTKDRPEQLRRVLTSLTAADYPQFEIIVVDNGPASGVTKPVVDEFAVHDVRLVEAVAPGLSVARNVGIGAANHEIVAFTDDDVVVDRRWLSNLARGFARGDEVTCVTGLVPTAEILTPAQAYFDRRVSWAAAQTPARYALDNPPTDDPLFPFRVACYGTGANFAIRKSAATDLGGFDEGMGVGSPTGGGEDIDMFIRVLLAGQTLAFEPSAVIWHRHRRTVEELRIQISDYGRGLGAWATKLMCRPRTAALVAARAVAAVRHLRSVTVVDDPSVPADLALAGLSGVERRGFLAGPVSLLRSRLQQRRPFPLRASVAGHDQAIGLASAAAAAGCAGLLGAIPVLPSLLTLVLLLTLALAGPGSLLMSWYSGLPKHVVLVLVPALGLATAILAVSGLLLLGFYSPVVVLLVLSCGCLIGGVARRRWLTRVATS